MAEDKKRAPDDLDKSYEDALTALSSLITKRSRADKSNKGDRFSLLFDYLKILELDEAISKMKIIHVAGTKGKGSTCTFTESILRKCGFHTGLFTSPHLIDVRERFCLDGAEISKEKFLTYFWWCFRQLKENVTEDVTMPTYFRFLALLAFKIFANEQVDVVILEVGLGGTFDATNVVSEPVVCGIASLGYDHMEILGNTLQQIATEKAGIFKKGVSAFTVPQPEEAMSALEDKASKLNVDLQVAPCLDATLLHGLKLGLDGEHQYVNAGLAVALASFWLQKMGHSSSTYLGNNSSLPEEFVSGLTFAKMQGRAQIVYDEYGGTEPNKNLSFYLDGAHSPESMEVCGRWFSLAVKGASHYSNLTKIDLQSGNNVPIDNASAHDFTQILLFNCMSVRDPHVLLPQLVNTCSSYGVQFKKALFVPNLSVYYKVGTHTSAPSDPDVDLSWQLSIQKIWETLVQGSRGIEGYGIDVCAGTTIWSGRNSVVFPSLPLAIQWLRERAQQNRSVRLQVLVAGSLHLIGDVLRLIRK